MDIRDLRGPHQAQRSVSCLWHSVLQREVLGQGIAQPHEHAALDLSLDGDGIDHLAGIMGRIDFFYPPVIVEDDHMGGESIGHMALRIRHVRTQLIGWIKEFREIFFPFQFLQITACRLKVFVQICGCHAHCFAGDQCLPGSGCGPGVRRHFGVGAHIDDPVFPESGGLCDHLHEYGFTALSDIGRRAVQLDLPVMYDQLCPAFIRQAHAHAGVLHGTGDPRPTRIAFISILNRQQSLFQCRRAVGDLSVRQDFPRLDGIAVADLPWRDAHLLRQQVDIGLQGEFALTYAESPECPGRRIIRIIPVSPDVCILITVRSHGMGAGALQHRSAQGRISACVKIDLAVQSREDPVLVTSQGKCALHGMALRMEINGFLPGECNLHRPVHLQRRQRRNMLGGHVLLAAKAAAHQLVLHHHAFRIPSQHDGDLMPRIIDALVR